MLVKMSNKISNFNKRKIMNWVSQYLIANLDSTAFFLFQIYALLPILVF